MKPPPDPALVRSLLVRANNWIGDVVLASPSLHALRAGFPGARISVLAQPGVLPALEGSPDLDEIIVFDPRVHAGVLGRVRLIRELRRRRFDLAVLFQKAFEAALLARAAGAKRSFGYDTDRRGLLLTDPVHETEDTRREHHARVFLDLVAAAGAPASDTRLRFPLVDEDRTRARAILAAADVPRNAPLVAVHPGTSKQPRAWHPARLGEAAGALARLVGGSVVVLGGPADAQSGAEAARHAGRAGPLAADLTGRTSIREMAAIFEAARLFIGNDSGPMHVAAAVGTPVLAIFGPGIPEKTAPFSDPVRWEAVTDRFPCSPCRQDFFRECEASPAGKPWCLEAIGVERVVGAGRQLLARTEKTSIPA